MAKHVYRIENPAFSEFVYSILYNASFDVKRSLPSHLLKLVRQESAAKKFARTASMDEASTVLSYLGVEHFQVFVARDSVTFKELKQILTKIETSQKVSSLKDIIEYKLFVTSDKEFITLLTSMGQMIHHRAYTMTLDLTRAGYHAQHWGKHLGNGSAPENQENSNVLAKMLLTSTLTLSRTPFLFRITPLEMQLLLYLYPLRATYVTMTQLSSYFVGHMTRNKLTGALKRLLESQHVQRSAIAKDPEYTISASGIRTVNEFMKAALHAASF